MIFIFLFFDITKVDRNKWGDVAESVVVVAKKRFVVVLL